MLKLIEVIIASDNTSTLESTNH